MGLMGRVAAAVVAKVDLSMTDRAFPAGRLALGGQVLSGRGTAAEHIEINADDIEAIIGQRVYPGSLNLVLDRPIRLEEGHALFFDRGHRMLWPATLDGLDVWLYRWTHTALHVVEVVAPFHIRDRLSIRDGDTVTIEVRRDHVARVDVIGWFTWALVWVGRQKWPYTRDVYYAKLRPHCRALGATQEKRTKGLNYMISKAVKEVIRRAPIIGPLVRSLRSKPNVLPKAKRNYTFQRIDGPVHEEAADRSLRQLSNLLAFTKSSNSDYSALEFPAGYHTIEFQGQTLAGQRKPGARLDIVPYDFTGRSVLDIGSNQGGMIFHLADKLRWSVGIDYDHRMVNAANWIARARGQNECRFFVFNLEQEPLDLIQDFLPEGRVDICFLLSVCMWIKNWRDVIDAAVTLSDAMVFESNGTDQQQADQLAYLQTKYASLQELSGASLDDPRQSRRKLYFLRNPIR